MTEISSNVYVDSRTITTGATPQRLVASGAGATSTGENNIVGSVVIKARKLNTSPLYVGNATTGGGASGSGISATTAFELQPGDSISLEIQGTSKIYIVGATTGDRYDILSLGA
jgi:hypothetical protein